MNIHNKFRSKLRLIATTLLIAISSLSSPTAPVQARPLPAPDAPADTPAVFARVNGTSREIDCEVIGG